MKKKGELRLLTVKLPAKLHNNFKVMAWKQGFSMTEIVIDLITKEVTAWQKKDKEDHDEPVLYKIENPA